MHYNVGKVVYFTFLCYLSIVYARHQPPFKTLVDGMGDRIDSSWQLDKESNGPLWVYFDGGKNTIQ